MDIHSVVSSQFLYSALFLLNHFNGF